MAQPAQAPLLKYGVHEGDHCLLKHCVVVYFVYPGDAQDAPRAAYVGGVVSSLLLQGRVHDSLSSSRVLNTQSLHTWTLVCSVSLLLDEILFVS